MFELPSYLEPLLADHVEYSSLNSTLYKYLLKEPGQGGFKGAEIVKFTEERSVYRIYGGENKAQQCGYWWNLEPPVGNVSTYFQEFAVCPEWNDATDMIKCTVPVGYAAVVGSGQSADCDDNSTLAPDESILQLNGAICDVIDRDLSLSCEFCAAREFSLEKSACATEEETSSAFSTGVNPFYSHTLMCLFIIRMVRAFF